MSELDLLRARMRAIDSEIIARIGERLATARRVGELKREAGIPLRDWEVERRVLLNAEQQATAQDVPAELARTILGQLIDAARQEQERTSFAPRAAADAAESVLVVGSGGRMGRWMAAFLANQGHRVTGWDAKEDAGGTRLRERLGDVTMVCISTPMEAIPGVLEELVDAGFAGVVFDIASLKGHLEPAIAAARGRGLRVTSLHPMFGPGTRTLADQVVCVCDCGDGEATRRAAAFFRETAATLIELSIDEHDRIAAYVLGLSHLTNIVFTQVLRGCGQSFGRLNEIGSTTFHSQMRTTATVIQEDPDLYFAIQRLNAFTPEVAATFERELRRINDQVRSGDAAGFRGLMTACRDWVREAAS